jgi:S1/P1 Nuclease
MRYFIVAVAVFGFCGDALAWGDTGHKTVCEIAFRLAAADTRAAIRKLVRSDTEFDTFSEACTGPDHPHTRASEHFINLPRDSAGLTADDNCPTADKCLLTAIINDTKVLAAKTSRPKDRLAALKFLGHWLGDIHQPLHVSFEDDRGGNNILVSGECNGKLHSTWDTCLVEDAIGTDVSAAATDLVDAITPEMTAKWTASDHPMDWANESFAIAEAVKTKYCTRHGASCDAVTGPLTIDAAYLKTNEPLVKEQIQKAGVRLARLLDTIFGN